MNLSAFTIPPMDGLAIPHDKTFRVEEYFGPVVRRLTMYFANTLRVQGSSSIFHIYRRKRAFDDIHLFDSSVRTGPMAVVR